MRNLNLQVDEQTESQLRSMAQEMGVYNPRGTQQPSISGLLRLLVGHRETILDALKDEIEEEAGTEVEVCMEHKWIERDRPWCRERKVEHWGMCYHVYECEKCGEVQGVDSSG